MCVKQAMTIGGETIRQRYAALLAYLYRKNDTRDRKQRRRMGRVIYVRELQSPCKYRKRMVRRIIVSNITWFRTSTFFSWLQNLDFHIPHLFIRFISDPFVYGYSPLFSCDFVKFHFSLNVIISTESNSRVSNYFVHWNP